MGMVEAEDSHKHLITQASLGEKNAMDTLYSLYSKAMLNTSYRLVNNLEDAEDVLQESFVKAFASLHQFQYRSTFGAWLKRIVVNKSLDQIKKNSKFGFHLEVSDNHAINYDENTSLFDDAALDEKLKLDKIYSAVQQLPTGYRTIFSLYLLEGYDHNEIAEILDIGVSTSISQLSRAKKKVKELIQQNK